MTANYCGQYTIMAVHYHGLPHGPRSAVTSSWALNTFMADTLRSPWSIIILLWWCNKITPRRANPRSNSQPRIGRKNLTCKTQFELLTKLLHCVVSTLHGCHNLYCMHQNLPQIFAETISPTVLWFLTYFRRDHVADELWVFLGNNRRNNFLDFNMLVKTLWNLVKTTFDNIGCPTSFSRRTSCGSFTNLTI